MKRLLSIFFILLFFLISSFQSTVDAEELDSFDLFWPIVAGRASDDALYPVKRLKEQLRGLFIFGAPQKTEYRVFLLTKRVVEAEKLLGDGKQELAHQTLESAASELSGAEKSFQRAKNRGDSFDEMEGQMTTRLGNLDKFTSWLAGKYESESAALTALNEKISSFLAKF